MDHSVRCKPEKIDLESSSNEIKIRPSVGQDVGESSNNYCKLIQWLVFNNFNFSVSGGAVVDSREFTTTKSSLKWQSSSSEDISNLQQVCGFFWHPNSTFITSSCWF